MTSHSVIEGDVLAGLRMVPDGSVHCCGTYNNTHNQYDSMCDNAYFAGLIDGEATVYVKKSTYRLRKEKYHDCVNPSYSPTIKVKMVNKEALQKLKETFGGSFYQERRTYPSRTGFKSNKVLWSWSVSDNNAINVCLAILPHSIVKKENIKNLLNLSALRKEAHKKRESNGKFHGQPYKQEWIDKFELCYLKSKELNS